MKLNVFVCRLFRVLRLAIVPVIAYAALANTAPAASNAAQSSSCVHAFPYKEGWLGGDAVYSIPLPDGRSLWLLGDSFVGSVQQTSREGTKMVRNAIALSNCDPRTGWDIHYFWHAQYKKNPSPFFDLQSGDLWYW